MRSNDIIENSEDNQMSFMKLPVINNSIKEK